ncbi:phage integrase N-terminal SAM-like domain-containing protein [Thermocoleostomius sinensis]|uniref:phage integrase N-terminal SAM-like domain-containing protein n=1 Tax=Thermocoleostomius sinensis TaxID=3065396 RepID=UPI0036F44576
MPNQVAIITLIEVFIWILFCIIRPLKGICRSLQQIFMVSRQARDVAFSTQVLLSSTRLAMASRPRKLLDQVCDTIRLKHYSYRTEQSYVAWIRRYSLFHICMKVGYRKR